MLVGAVISPHRGRGDESYPSISVAARGRVYFFLHRASVATQTEREWQTTQVAKIENLGSTQSLLILPLVEAAASGPAFQAEHGVSYLVKTDKATILFDLGMNASATNPSPLQANMQQLGVGEDDFQILVISHDHPDHTGGVQWWRTHTFSLGNQQTDLSAKVVYVPAPLSYPGLTPVVTKQPAKIAEGVATLGGIPFVEVWQMALFREHNVEQALAVNVADTGIILITGCGHQTLPKLIARAEALFDVPITGIVGGLHLGNATAQELAPSIRLLQTLQPRLVALSPHDSGETPRQALRAAFPGVYQDILVGQPIGVGVDHSSQ